MKIIEKLSGMIEEEIADAVKYGKCAVELKETYPDLSETFYNLSIEEMKHMSILHGEVAKFIEKYRREHGEPPEAMQIMYDMIHNRHIADAKEAKVYQAMYREQ